MDEFIQIIIQYILIHQHKCTHLLIQFFDNTSIIDVNQNQNIYYDIFDLMKHN